MIATGDYLVSHGKSGAFGRFSAQQPMTLERGDRVAVATSRGIEAGTVLCPATAGHLQRLGDKAAGKLLRLLGPGDEEILIRLVSLQQQLFQEARELLGTLQVSAEILDIEVLLDGRRAIIQCLIAQETDLAPLAETLEQRHGLEVLLENL